MREDKYIYLLQGLYFNEILSYGIGIKPGIGVVREDSLPYHFFQGMVTVQPEHTVCGYIKDKFGEADIYNFRISEKKMSFRKCYKDRSAIYYSFDKFADGFWVGSYTGTDVGKGKVHCLVTSVNEGFFDSNH